MIAVFLSALLFSTSGNLLPDLEEVRYKFLLAGEENEYAEELYNNLRNYGQKNEVLLAYKGAARAMMAESVRLPTSKYKLFNEGKKALESAVSKNNTSVEIRFIRFAVQDNIPSFLNYDNRIEDYSFINTNLKTSDLPQSFRSAIKKVLNQSDFIAKK